MNARTMAFPSLAWMAMAGMADEALAGQAYRNDAIRLQEASRWTHEGPFFEAGQFRIMSAGGGKDLAGWQILEASVRNKSRQRRAVQVHVALFAGTGRLVAAAALKRKTDQPLGSTLAAGETAVFRELVFVPRTDMEQVTRLSIKVSGGGIVGDETLKALAAPSEEALKLRCAENLRKLCLACIMYATDHRESFPASLEELLPRYVRTRDSLSCPGRREGVGYVYIEGLSSADPARLVLAYDKQGNHEEGRNVVFVFGQAKWMREEQFKEALAKTQDYLAKKGRSPRR